MGTYNEGIQAMGKMIQEVQSPVEQLIDDELKQLESVPALSQASEIFESSTWASSSSIFIKPVVLCIKDRIDNIGSGNYYTNSLVPSKDVKHLCEFIGKAQIVATQNLAHYTDQVFKSAQYSFKDNFMFACTDCVRNWARYNPTRPPRSIDNRRNQTAQEAPKKIAPTAPKRGPRARREQ